MDPERFDRLSRSMLVRRGALRAIVGSAGVGVLGLFGSPVAARAQHPRRCPRPPTCPGACASPCQFCLTRAAGPPLCAGQLEQNCALPCASDNDCLGTDNRPYCVTTVVVLQTGQVANPCQTTEGRCTGATPCMM